MTWGIGHLLQILGRRVENFGLIPLIRELRQGDHLQILIGDGIGENLKIFRFDLLVALQTGIEIYGGIGLFPGFRRLAFGFIRHGKLDGGNQPVPVGQAHGQGSAVGGGDRNGHVFQRKPGGAGVSAYLYVSCS